MSRRQFGKAANDRLTGRPRNLKPMSFAFEWFRADQADIGLRERAKIAAERSRGESSPLSNKEREVLDLIVHGDSNQVIADALGVSINTVKHHLKNIFSKLRVKSRAQVFATQVPFRLEDKRPNDIWALAKTNGGMRGFVVAGLHAGASNKQMARELMVSTPSFP